MGALQNMRQGLVRALEVLVMSMVALLTLTVLWGVFTRFVIGHQAQYTDELARLLLVWVSMIGAALAFGEKAHLGVDFFVNHLHPEARKTLSVAVQVIIVALALTVFITGGWSLAMAQMGQELPTLRPLTRGMVYLSLPVAGGFIALFALENLVAILKTPADRLGAQTQSEG